MINFINTFLSQIILLVIIVAGDGNRNRLGKEKERAGRGAFHRRGHCKIGLPRIPGMRAAHLAGGLIWRNRRDKSLSFCIL